MPILMWRTRLCVCVCFWVEGGPSWQECISAKTKFMWIYTLDVIWLGKIQQNNLFIQCKLLHIILKRGPKIAGVFVPAQFWTDDASWISWQLPLFISTSLRCIMHFCMISQRKSRRTWWKNARGHNHTCLKCKIGCSKCTKFISNKDIKLNTCTDAQIIFVMLDSTCSHDHIATVYTILSVTGIWPSRSLKSKKEK